MKSGLCFTFVCVWFAGCVSYQPQPLFPARAADDFHARTLTDAGLRAFLETNGGVTPWILGGVLDLPVETMGKRKHRVRQAEHLSEAARCDLANTAWSVRNRVRTNLLALQTVQATAALARDQAEALGRVARLVAVQWQAGAVSPVEVSAARAALALLPPVLKGNVPGHEIEFPMALVILGGLVTSTMLNLLLLPALYGAFARKLNA
jgi:hypothetical protein